VRFFLHYGDLTDSTNLIRIMQAVQPTRSTTSGRMSHVKVSFEAPEYTANADGLGTLRLLEAIRILGWRRRPASTRPRPPSCTAWCRNVPQRETTPVLPALPTPWPSCTATGSR
jgi:GDPmannose 4,6-dehydratase